MTRSRAKALDGKTWLYGYFARVKAIATGEYFPYIVDGGICIENTECAEIDGLYDKWGNQIFINDIVREVDEHDGEPLDNNFYVVEWDDEDHKLVLTLLSPNKRKMIEVDKFFETSFMLVGNVFDDEKLLQNIGVL